MSEDVQASSPEVTDPTALSLAMAGASRAEADAFLRDQRHHIHEQLKQIHLDIFEKWLGVALRLATLCVGIGAATGVCLMVWDAAHANGLLIEPFSVPPDMAAKGLSGQVIASQVQDKLTEMQAATMSFRPSRSYANNWGNDIKVEIPETGVSIGEFRRFLREWLGNDTHISGEVWHTDQGLAISARTGGERGATFSGAPSDLDVLVQKAAEHVYGQTQPYRYAVYLRGGPRRPSRPDEARAIFEQLTATGSREEQGWAWQGLATIPEPNRRNADAVAALRKAVAIYPDYTLGHSSLGTVETASGHAETGLAEAKIVTALLKRSTVPDLDPVYIAIARAGWPLRQSLLEGDFAHVVEAGKAGLALPDQAGQRDAIRLSILIALGQMHDSAATRAFLSPGGPAPLLAINPRRRAILQLQAEAGAENWQTVLSLEAPLVRMVEEAVKLPTGGNPFDRADTLATIYPWTAMARAKLGDIKGAEATIAPMPGDCYDCLRVRGMIAAEGRQWQRADFWFTSAVREGPSIPFAFENWGRSLLKRGEPDAAIAKFKLANQRGRKFADPLEGWGEALMAKNQSHRALAKFAEAEKYAPNWGRLHLKWGEALVYARKPQQAKAQFARAALLDLTPAEKNELARMNRV